MSVGPFKYSSACVSGLQGSCQGAVMVMELQGKTHEMLILFVSLAADVQSMVPLPKESRREGDPRGEACC